MRKSVICVLALLAALAASCNKGDGERLAQLQDELSALEQAELPDVPSAPDVEVLPDGEFAISFDKQGYGIDAGESVTIRYSLPDAATVEVSARDGWSAAVSATSPDEGTIVVTAPDPASPTEIVVTAIGEGGRQIASILPLMVRDPYSASTRTYVNALGYYNLKPQWATADNFRKLAEAGLKSVTVECEDYDFKQQIALAHQAGLKSLCIIGWAGGRYASNPEGYRGLDDIVNYLKEQPGVFAYHICDEPSIVDIPRLKFIKEKVESLDPEHPVYINLNPDGSVNALGTASYREYIESYARDCGCKFISFDMYPILQGGLVMPGWHKCLRIVADVTREYGIPFWAFAASCWIDSEGGIVVRGRPSVENLRLQVYTDLAYGAQVVQYFTIQQYSGTTLAPMMYNGEWSEAYDYLKEANLQVQNRGFVFDGCSVGKIRFCQTPATWGENLSAADLPESIGSLETSGTALVSFIENRGNSYIAIVNQSYTQKITAMVSFDGMAYTIERDGSFAEHLPGSEQFTIDEGDLMVIKVK